MDHLPCCHCLAEAIAELKLDRKGRPYIRCHACGSLSFLHHERAMAGTKYLVPRIFAEMRQRYGSVEKGREALMSEGIAAEAASG